MTRRRFIKRIGGVAAGALAVASIPTAQIFQAAEVRITSNGFQMYPLITMQDTVGITSPIGMTRQSFEKALSEYFVTELYPPPLALTPPGK